MSAPDDNLRRCGLLVASLLAAALAGCKTIEPSNHRAWSPDQVLVPRIEQRGNIATVYNVRNNEYRSEEDYTVQYEDRKYDLRKLKTLDFLIVPFKDMPSIAHTMLSFGFDDGEHLVLSVEIRKEDGEKYAAWKGGLRQYELMYVLGDERDLIELRTNHRGDDVYMYRTRAKPAQVRMIFEDVAARANKLATVPEFYDTFTNNCTTNIAQHVNKLSPGRVPYDIRVLLPGYSDRLAYDLGLLDTELPFEETKQRAWISGRARAAVGAADFSDRIRR